MLTPQATNADARDTFIRICEECGVGGSLCWYRHPSLTTGLAWIYCVDLNLNSSFRETAFVLLLKHLCWVTLTQMVKFWFRHSTSQYVPANAVSAPVIQTHACCPLAAGYVLMLVAQALRSCLHAAAVSAHVAAVGMLYGYRLCIHRF